MSYERLTRKDGTRVQHSDCVSICENDYGKRVDFMEAYNRLAELEDKIENGTLVELPCKVGDKVYKVYGRCGSSHCIYNGDYGQWRCSYKGQARCKPFIDEIPFALSDLQEVDKTIFFTKSEAEEKLRELNDNLIALREELKK